MLPSPKEELSSKNFVLEEFISLDDAMRAKYLTKLEMEEELKAFAVIILLEIRRCCNIVEEVFARNIVFAGGVSSSSFNR